MTAEKSRGSYEQDIDVDLRLRGKIVTRCFVDAAFGLEFYEKNASAHIRVGGRMIIEQGDTRLELLPEKPMEAAQGIVLLRKTIGEAIARKDGTLDIIFTDGTKLAVPVDPNYEAWEMSAEDGFMVVSLPGGRLAIWSPKSEAAAK